MLPEPRQHEVPMVVAGYEVEFVWQAKTGTLAFHALLASTEGHWAAFEQATGHKVVHAGSDSAGEHDVTISCRTAAEAATAIAVMHHQYGISGGHAYPVDEENRQGYTGEDGQAYYEWPWAPEDDAAVGL